MNSRPSALLVLLISITPLAAVAADDSNVQSTSQSQAVSSETDLRTILSVAGNKLHKHFVLDPHVQGRIDLLDLNPSNLSYGQVLALLKVHGYVVEDAEGLELVVPSGNMARAAVPVVNPDKIDLPDFAVVTTIVPLKGINANQLIPVIRPMLPADAQIAGVSGKNALLLTDYASDVKRLVAVARALDALPPMPEPGPKD